MSPFFVVGTNFKNSPLEFREALARLWDADPKKTLCSIKNHFNGTLQELCLLSTCNRYELYANGSERLERVLRDFLLSQEDLPPTNTDPLYCFEDKRALNHLFSVASGLDSMVLGETEILGQVKKAYETARNLEVTGSLLNTSFQKALCVGKRVRQETLISRGRLSVASVALDLARKIFADFSEIAIAVVGAGAVGHEVAKNLLKTNPRFKFFVSRSLERAEALAQEFGGVAYSLESLGQVFKASDVVVCQLACEAPVIGVQMVKKAASSRRRALFIVDIAMPRNVEEAVGQIPNVYLYNIDDLKAIAEVNHEKRKGEILNAKGIVNEEVEKFLVKWQKAIETTKLAQEALVSL